MMLGYKPCAWWGICWRFITPALIAVIDYFAGCFFSRNKTCRACVCRFWCIPTLWIARMWFKISLGFNQPMLCGFSGSFKSLKVGKPLEEAKCDLYAPYALSDGPPTLSEIQSNKNYTHTCKFNGHLSRWTWVSWFPLNPLLLIDLDLPTNSHSSLQRLIIFYGLSHYQLTVWHFHIFVSLSTVYVDMY